MGYIYIITIISLFFLRVTRENIPCGQHRNAQGAVSPVETRTRRWGPAGQVQVSERAAGRQQAPPWGSGTPSLHVSIFPAAYSPALSHITTDQRSVWRDAPPGLEAGAGLREVGLDHQVSRSCPGPQAPHLENGPKLNKVGL